MKDHLPGLGWAGVGADELLARAWSADAVAVGGTANGTSGLTLAANCIRSLAFSTGK